MQKLDAHLKEGNFCPVYLLYGTDSYLKRFYRNRICSCILPEDDGMNLTKFQGKAPDLAEVSSIASTLPFFQEHRILVLEDTGYFKTSNDFVDIFSNLPDSTVLLFVESEVDKRNRLYQYVQKHGLVTELSGMTPEMLTRWIKVYAAKGGKEISGSGISYLMGLIGTDTSSLSNELEKLIAYTGTRSQITTKDMDAICTGQIIGKIFDMTDAIVEKKQKKALSLYRDLLSLRESPASILFLLTRQYNLILQSKDLMEQGRSGEIASVLHVPPFVAKKCMQQAKVASKKDMEEYLVHCATAEESFKTGGISEGMSVELLLLTCSSK